MNAGTLATYAAHLNYLLICRDLASYARDEFHQAISLEPAIKPRELSACILRGKGVSLLS